MDKPKKKTPNTTYQTLTTKHYLSNRNDQTKPPTQTKSTKPKHPYQTNQTYQIDFPNSTYQIEPIKPNLAQLNFDLFKLLDVQIESSEMKTNKQMGAVIFGAASTQSKYQRERGEETKSVEAVRVDNTRCGGSSNLGSVSISPTLSHLLCLQPMLLSGRLKKDCSSRKFLQSFPTKNICSACKKMKEVVKSLNKGSSILVKCCSFQISYQASYKV